MTNDDMKKNLALATAALGAGVGLSGGAEAITLTSTTSAGFTPTTVSEAFGNYVSFDIAGSSFTIRATTQQNKLPGKIFVTGPTGSQAATTNGYIEASAQPDLTAGTYSSLAGSPFGQGIASGTTSNFGATTQYGTIQLATPAQTSYYYFAGSLTGTSFTLTDYGTVSAGTATAAVPEPETWALLALGMGGIGAAMRRRQATRALAA